MYRRTLRLITFDVNNTLMTVARDIGAEYAKVATIYGVKGVDDPDRVRRISEAFPENYRRLDKQLPNFGHNARISSVEWWSRVVTGTFADAGFDDEADRRRIRSTAAHLFKLYSRGSQWQLRSGVNDLLFDLRKQRPEITLAVLSNFDERLESILRDLGIVHYFRYLFCSRTIGHAKPEPEIFQHVFAKTGIENAAREYLHIGDSVTLDYRATIREPICGNALLLCDGEERKREIIEKSKPEIDQSHIVSSLSDLRKILEI